MEPVDPTSDVSSNGNLQLGLAQRLKRKLPWVNIMSVFLSLLLCWQLAGTCLYFIRCLQCFGEKWSTFLCERNAAFPYSEEFEFTWLVSHSMLLVIMIVALQKVPEFPGYLEIFHQLKLRPSFWTLHGTSSGHCSCQIRNAVSNGAQILTSTVDNQWFCIVPHFDRCTCMCVKLYTPEFVEAPVSHLCFCFI